MMKVAESLEMGEEVLAKVAPPCGMRAGGVFLCACDESIRQTGRRCKMMPDSSQVIIEALDERAHPFRGLAVHHRDFPEVRGEGRSPKDAAERLAQLLTQTLDRAPSKWRRECIVHAIEDIREFTERSRA